MLTRAHLSQVVVVSALGSCLLLGGARECSYPDQPPESEAICPEDYDAALDSECHNVGHICQYDTLSCSQLVCSDGLWLLQQIEGCVQQCSPPDYPSECAAVTEFQCGVSPRCADENTLVIGWHEHVFCGEDTLHEQIVEYSCSHTCDNGCRDSGSLDWSWDGNSMIAAFCGGGCPDDLAAAHGQPCVEPGKSCSEFGDGGCPACGDCEMVTCEDGAWAYYEIGSCQDPCPASVDQAGACTNLDQVCSYGDGACQQLVCDGTQWQIDPACGACNPPVYSDACIDVGYYQCGPSVVCLDGVITIGWHEHVSCTGDYTDELIVDYGCTHQCEHGCAADPPAIWPDGTNWLSYCANHVCCGVGNSRDVVPADECPAENILNMVRCID